MGRARMGALIAAGGLIVGALLGPTSVTAQEAGTKDTVTVEARREVDVEPDIGRVVLGVRAKGLTAEEATERLTNRARRVLDALTAAGFTDEELSTQSVNLDRRCLRLCRDPNPNDEERPTPVFGYVGSAGIEIETRRLDAIGDAIDVGVRAGATGIRSVSFDVEDRSEAVKEALRQAMVLATDKARVLAETGNRTLGRALIIIEGNAREPRAFFVDDDALAARAVLPGTAGGGGSAGGGSNPFPIEPPTLSASARVEVTFELL